MITILKTLTAKVLCNKLQLPVILVKSMGKDIDSNLINYLSTEIDFDCIFFFDEYEKEFKDSSLVLSFMDGVHNSIYRKIFLLTTNNLHVDSNLIGRPSRIRYKKSFGNLSEEVVREILEDALDDKSAIDSIVDLTHTMNIVTIDLVKAIATEINIHGINCIDTIKDIFNIEFANYTYVLNYFSIRKGNIDENNLDVIIEECLQYVVLDNKITKTEKEKDRYKELQDKYYMCSDTCTSTRKFEYIKSGDKFYDLRVVKVIPTLKVVVLLGDSGILHIVIVNKCYSNSKTSGLNLVF